MCAFFFFFGGGGGGSFLFVCLWDWFFVRDMFAGQPFFFFKFCYCFYLFTVRLFCLVGNILFSFATVVTTFCECGFSSSVRAL